MIRLIPRKEVDEQWWNGIVSRSRHETVYPYAWYLDAVADNWSLLAMKEQPYYMPVAWKKKLGIRYVCQPLSTQQLGVLTPGDADPDPEIVRAFLHRLPRHFRMGDYAFNQGNLVGDEPGFDVQDNTNYELNLDRLYEKIHKQYNTNTRRNINKAFQAGLQVTDKIGMDEFIEQRKVHDPLRRNDRVYEVLTRLVYRLINTGKGTILGIRNRQGTLVAAALFASCEHRSVYLHSFSDEEGREHRSMFQVIDHFIQMHAGEPRILDFEGSNISTIARFFAGFGARPVIYQRVSFNRLTAGLKRRRRHG